MRKRIPALALGAAALCVAPARSQVAFEARLDAGIPIEETGQLYDTGVGFGLRASLDLAPGFALYGGYSRFDLDVDESILPDAELEIEGFELGGRVELQRRPGTGAGTPYFLLGALFQDDDTGLQAGLGVDYPMSWALAVTPEVRYRKVNQLTCITLGMGARIRF